MPIRPVRIEWLIKQTVCIDTDEPLEVIAKRAKAVCPENPGSVFLGVYDDAKFPINQEVVIDVVPKIS